MGASIDVAGNLIMKKIIDQLPFLTFLVIRKTIYLALYLLSSVLPRNKVVILCYHSISDDSWRYGVDYESLQRQMKSMLEHYNPVTLDQIEQFIRGEIYFNTPVFAVTFDDGYSDILRTTSLFSELGIKPTAFVLARPDAVDYEELGAHLNFLNDSQIHELINSGWEIGSHSLTHTDFYSLTNKQAEEEIISSKAILEQKTGKPIKYFAYPKGRYTDVALRAVTQAGYRAAFSMDDQLLVSGTDARVVPRVGVDRTHTDWEFKATISVAAVLMRGIVKKLDKAISLLRKNYENKQ
jgi:peptidoglycan/xylan/chitin deacetylase (PgdA/CDA1 family)